MGACNLRKKTLKLPRHPDLAMDRQAGIPPVTRLQPVECGEKRGGVRSLEGIKNAVCEAVRILLYH